MPKMFIVQQIPYRSREDDIDMFHARRDVICGDPVDPFLEMYEEVAIIEAEDLDEVFKIGNVGPDDMITRLAPEMRSVSVGDIIIDTTTDEWFAVAAYSFKKVEK
jgi:hypothetical protein